MVNSRDAIEDMAKDEPMFEQINSKSAVKIIKNSRGVNWEVRVVAGEEGLIEGLRMIALRIHRELEKDLDGKPFEE